jgi:CheY-like chemotaxis protein
VTSLPVKRENSQRAKTILLVEDQLLIARMNTTIIEGFGYNVITARTGEEAVNAVDMSYEIDLVLMDVELGSGIDGTEAARQIMALRDLPIVFLTSHSEREYVERVREITRYGYVIKNSGEFVLQSSIAMAFELFDANQQTILAKRKLEATLNALPDLLLELDSRGVCISYHSPVGDINPLISTEFIGRNVTETMSAQGADTILSAIAEAERTGTSFGREFPLFRGEKTRWYEISVAKKPVEPEISNYIVLQRDITVRKHTEEALIAHKIELQEQGEEVRTQQEELEEHRSKYFNLYEFSPVSIIGFSEAGIIKDVNLTAASQFQSARSSLVGQLISRLISPADQDIFYLARKRLMASETSGESDPRQTFKITLVGADKTTFVGYAQLSLSRVNNKQGNFALVVMPENGDTAT